MSPCTSKIPQNYVSLAQELCYNSCTFHRSPLWPGGLLPRLSHMAPGCVVTFVAPGYYLKRGHADARSVALRLWIGLAIVLPVLLPPGHSTAQSDSGGRFYPATGHTLAPQFLNFFDHHGDVPLFGYPIGEAHMEGGYLVQWTERQRLEWHPENSGTQYEVLLGLLGQELTHGLDGPRFSIQHAEGSGQQTLDNRQSAAHCSPPSANCVFFPETGQSVAEPFLSYWRDNGGLEIFGYPISTLFTDDHGLQVQWFQRTRIEYHPELSTEKAVLLGHLGYEALDVHNLPDYTFNVSGNPAPDTSLQVGLSQGGESTDPHFLDNVRVAGSALGPGLVRLDNIFNFYNVVQRAPDGTIGYHWDELDQVLDDIQAMGKEPFICLSYMPETMSANGTSRVSPPVRYDEWAALVRATVTHVNIDRKLGVRYWEVWNEPNEWQFWQASYPEYFKLYDVTVEAALSADPTIQIGGPSLSRFSVGHFDELLAHEASLRCQGQGAGGQNPSATPTPTDPQYPAPGTGVACGRVDFLSWHSYGESPDELAFHIRWVREIASYYPQFNPQLFITEFNVQQGGIGDTSADGSTDTAVGAISLLSSIESMQRERLDRALLFELKDGPGPKPYWGKWGVLNSQGDPKPVYYTLKAYQARPPGGLPADVVNGPSDGTLGLMAFGDDQKTLIFLWYTGQQSARVKLALPTALSHTQFQANLFDEAHNNPARTGNPNLDKPLVRDAGDLVFTLKPNSLLIIRNY
jgi:hypothetical protein